MPDLSPPAAARLAEHRDCALAVIDVQKRLLPYIHRGEQVVANVGKLVRFAQLLDLPILWAEQENLGETADEIRELLQGRSPIRKIHFGGFRCAEFAAAARALGRRTLIFCGVEAHVCVAQTALGALPEFAVHVVADAVSSRHPDNREVALARLRQAGAVITSTEMVMFEVMARAGTDTFRAVLPLIK
ncbi:MAG: hydrolase [Deferrisomatales bacterium]